LEAEVEEGVPGMYVSVVLRCGRKEDGVQREEERTDPNAMSLNLDWPPLFTRKH
jgi:hypothetical protein